MPFHRGEGEAGWEHSGEVTARCVGNSKKSASRSFDPSTCKQLLSDKNSTRRLKKFRLVGFANVTHKS